MKLNRNGPWLVHNKIGKLYQVCTEQKKKKIEIGTKWHLFLDFSKTQYESMSYINGYNRVVH